MYELYIFLYITMAYATLFLISVLYLRPEICYSLEYLSALFKDHHNYITQYQFE